MTIIKPENILHALAATASNQPDTLPILSQLFCKAYNIDPFPNKVLEMLKKWYETVQGYYFGRM
jgi:hypothetical protein